MFEPVVRLEEVETTSGEEDEDVMYKVRAKLYRYGETLLDKGTGTKTWVDRGVGEIKILKHRETQQQRLLMRQEKTLKLCVNTLIDPRISMVANVSSDKAWVWSCFDFSSGELVEEVFSAKFTNVETATLFKEKFETAQQEMAALIEGADATPSAEADEAAEALQTLSTAEGEAPAPSEGTEAK